MAIYRNVHMSFWSDSKVTDEFSPEDRLMFLYIMTNPHTNLSGCYEISIRQVALETGYSVETAKTILMRLCDKFNVARYSEETKELLVLNWSKYNWTKSEKFLKPLVKEISAVKCADFKAYLEAKLNEENTVSIPYTYRTDTTDTVTVTENNNKHKSTKFNNFTSRSYDFKELERSIS